MPWRCPICLELAYKPCVNSCGHIFCFWCLHHAMNTYEASTCPSCRSSFSYFPWICEALHKYFSDAFPEEYKAREEAVTGISLAVSSELEPFCYPHS
uniref:Prt1 protein n=1 Tax=Tetraselmis sp. GSL018 TaxID=582737 RepID=A0A061S4F2_9CHLO